MPSFKNGSLHLFRVFGIDVFVHWSWFLVAYFFVSSGYFGGSTAWGLLTYVSLFAIVLLHEFGHSLACRSVGGTAKNIVLWPLGGVAFVNPPARPGPVLWSIVAGPLVNVVLFPILGGLLLMFVGFPPYSQLTDFQTYLTAVFTINAALLIFNMMPVYPLDGGQTLQAILWFFIGRARSLRVVSVIGMIVAAIVAVLLLASGIGGRDWFTFAIVLFIGWQAYNGYRTAQYLAKHEQMTDANAWRVVRDAGRPTG